MAAYKQDTEYMAHVGHLIACTKVQKLSEITHHYHSTRLEHSINVSYTSYKLAKKLGWNWCITDTTANPASSNSLISCGFKMYTPANPWSFKNACYWKYKVNQDAVQGSERKKKKKQRVQP